VGRALLGFDLVNWLPRRALLRCALGSGRAHAVGDHGTYGQASEHSPVVATGYGSGRAGLND